MNVATKIKAAMAFAAIAVTSQMAIAQPFTNGGFEDPFDFNSWTIDPAFTGSLLVCDTNAATAHSGSRSAHFGAHEGQPDILSKHIATEPGMTYRISFWLASDNIAPIYDSFIVTWGDQVLLDLSNPQNGFPYTQYVYNVEAASFSEELAFHGFKRFGSFRLDDVNLSIAPASNTCSAAPRIVPNFTYTSDNLTATNDANPSCGLLLGADVWYRLIAPCDSTLTMNTCGSNFDTTLSVFTGACGALSEVACNDDNGGQGPCPGGGTSFVSLPVTAGATYYIRIAGFNAFIRGTFNLDVRMPLPENDACVDAIPVQLGITNGNNNCATQDGQYSCAPSVSHDLWYSYTPACDHTLRVNTCGSNWDTVLAAYIGDCGSLTEVQCNDDTSGCGPNSRGSSLEFPVIAGTRYLIAVAQFGLGAAQGDFVLNLSSTVPRHDTCATAQHIVDGPHSFDARCASQSSARYCNDAPLNRPGYWFEYTAFCTGQVFVDICDTEGASGAWLSAFAGSCDFLNCVGAQQLSSIAVCPEGTEAFGFDAVEGTTYYICYTPPPGNPLRSGTITMKPVRPDNDFCLEATTIGEGTFYEDTTCASVDGASACGNSNGTPDVWYLWTAACEGQLQLDTCGSEFDTVLSVYRGSCADREELACNDDDPNSCPSSNRTSRIVLDVAAGESYWIRVSGYNGAVGLFQLNVQFIGANNFTCADAAPIAAGSTEFDGACASGAGGRFCNTPIDNMAVWFAFTPECTGPKTLEFCRTGGPASGLFSVFTGDCNMLTCVASRNANSIPQFCPAGMNVLSFHGVAGTTYLICYTQFAGTPLGAGALTIRETGPTNDDCSAPAALILGTSQGTTACASPDAPAGCLSGADDVWYSFTPTASGRLSLDTCDSATDTLLAVYSGACGGLSLLACSTDTGKGGGPCFDSNAAYLTLDVIAGTAYRIRVGTQFGAGGSFTLHAALTAANDNCADAQYVATGSTLTGDLTFATSDGADTCSPSSGDRDVWYRWTPGGCESRLVLDTCGSSIDTVVSVYRGNCGALTLLDCDNNANNEGPCPGTPGVSYLNTSILPFNSYYIRVAGVNGATGPFTLHVNSEAPRPDQCNIALPITNGVTTFNGQCGGQDASGTAVSCDVPNMPALWFAYTATCPGVISVDLCGTNYDSIVSVHSGTCGNLTEIACNDNAGATQCPGNPFNSYVAFQAESGQTYIIRVSSRDAELADGQMLVRCFGVPCPADLNRDGVVDLLDLTQLLGHFGMNGGALHSDGDITGESTVDLSDLAILLSAFGTYCS